MVHDGAIGQSSFNQPKPSNLTSGRLEQKTAVVLTASIDTRHFTFSFCDLTIDNTAAADWTKLEIGTSWQDERGKACGSDSAMVAADGLSPL